MAKYFAKLDTEGHIKSVFRLPSNTKEIGLQEITRAEFEAYMSKPVVVTNSDATVEALEQALRGTKFSTLSTSNQVIVLAKMVSFLVGIVAKSNKDLVTSLVSLLEQYEI